MALQCDAGQPPVKNLIKDQLGDGTVPVWSASITPNSNHFVTDYGANLGAEGLKHSTIFAHDCVQERILCRLVLPSCAGGGARARASASAEMETAFDPQEEMSVKATQVVRVFGEGLQLHAYGPSDIHTGPLPDGSVEEGIPDTSHYSDRYTHKLWLPGSLADYQVVVRSLTDGAAATIELESWENESRTRQVEFELVGLDASDSLHLGSGVDGDASLTIDRGGTGFTICLGWLFRLKC